MSTQVDRLTKLTSQLVGDVSRLEGVSLSPASEAQLVQLLTDAFEAVGLVALDQADESLLGPKPPCVAHDCGYAEPHYHGQGGIYPTDVRV